MKKLHLIVAVVGIAAASGAGWWYQQRAAGDKALAAVGGAPASGPRAGAAPGGPGGPGSGPVAVEVGKVESVRLDDDAQAVGTLRARQSVMLRPEVSGRIAKLGFVDGQRVKRGQLLVQLDDTLQQAQLKQAEAQANIARTNLQRSRELAAQNFVSQSAVDQNAAALDVAMAQVALAQAQTTRMRVLAPFDAVAGISTVNVGDYLKDGADMVGLEDLSSMAVDFRLPERFLARIKPGQPVDVQLDAMPGRSFKGRVEALDAQVDANGRAVLVRARIDNPGTTLKTGLFARARIVFSSREAALLVPEEALVPIGGRQLLFKIIEGEGGAKTARRIEAKMGLRVPGKVEILEGLSAGDLVVTAGHGRLVRAESTPVRVVDIDKPPGPRRGPGGAASGAGSGTGRGGTDGGAAAASGAASGVRKVPPA